MKDQAEIQKRLNDFLEVLKHQGDATMVKYNQLQSAIEKEGYTTYNISNTLTWRKSQVELYDGWLAAFRCIKQDAGQLQYVSNLYKDILNTEIMLVKNLNEARNNLNQLIKTILDNQ